MQGRGGEERADSDPGLVAAVRTVPGGFTQELYTSTRQIESAERVARARFSRGLHGGGDTRSALHMHCTARGPPFTCTALHAVRPSHALHCTRSALHAHCTSRALHGSQRAGPPGPWFTGGASVEERLPGTRGEAQVDPHCCSRI